MSDLPEEESFQFQALLLGAHKLKPSEQVYLDELQSGICFRCKAPGSLYRRNTAYNDSLSNYACCCEGCRAMDDEEMADRWREYYSGLM